MRCYNFPVQTCMMEMIIIPENISYRKQIFDIIIFEDFWYPNYLCLSLTHPKVFTLEPKFVYLLFITLCYHLMYFYSKKTLFKFCFDEKFSAHTWPFQKNMSDFSDFFFEWKISIINEFWVDSTDFTLK